MNQKTKNIALIILSIVVIFSLVLIYRNVKESKNTETNEVKNEVDVQVDETVIEPAKETEENVSVDIDKKFNTAIANAQKASLDGQSELAIKYYNEALTYKKNDSAPYAGLYTVYLNQKKWNEALNAINKGIQISPLFGDYWNWKILVMDQGLNKTFSELKKVYDEGYPKVRTNEKVNLVTKFAVVAENKGEKAEAIKLWQKAIELVPENTIIYQAEIDRLNR
ncbi:hypothetical protein IT418_00185 [bacterium]|nr:hypothetical protein [bacterium]